MGIDIGMPSGTELYAVSVGQVNRIQTGLLSIRVGAVYEFYLHIQAVTVTLGAMVTPGELVAYSGAVMVDPRFPITGPHLHFEVQSGYQLPGTPTYPEASLDPLPYLAGLYGARAGTLGDDMTPAQEAILRQVLAAV